MTASSPPWMSSRAVDPWKRCGPSCTARIGPRCTMHLLLAGTGTMTELMADRTALKIEKGVVRESSDAAEADDERLQRTRERLEQLAKLTRSLQMEVGNAESLSDRHRKQMMRGWEDLLPRSYEHLTVKEHL